MPDDPNHTTTQRGTHMPPAAGEFGEHPHRRLNPLTDEWVLVSPHRNKRPWLGIQEETPGDDLLDYDPDCHLCPGNRRASGMRNPDYEGPFVFANDFPALLPDTPPSQAGVHPVFRTHTVRGTARVICFSPRHDLNLPELPVEDIRRIIDVWAEQIADLGKSYDWVAIFENKGAMMGCSNPHPHGQIWATDFLPNEILREDQCQRRFTETHGTVLLRDYLESELLLAERVVVENSHWVAVVPYWAVWPFETLLMPRRHVLRLTDLTAAERDGLADTVKRLTTRYDNLFRVSFPYSMGWHGAPTRQGDHAHWQLHAHFYPPLLRSASIRKFMVGFEMLAEAQRDMTAEQAAERLRGLSDVHHTRAKVE